ncbi:MAG: apaG [Candidatus Midichloriaceae bacterium]|jgi:ApaG protein|nr:apaG [Candidatus Midichloriaceae bacterium]
MKHLIETANNIEFEVKPRFIGRHCSCLEATYVWSYRITINNLGKTDVQLLSRCRKLIDTNGLYYEGRVYGVSGDRPIIRAGGSYSYTSSANLKTPSGILLGNCELLDLKHGNILIADVLATSLDSPYQIVSLV